MSTNIIPTGKEVLFNNNEIIVSKTNTKGHITYVNDIFISLSGYSEKELLGSPHSVIRHPDMPRCIFKLLWDKISNKEEIFAYVVNMSKNGDHYWVFAHVTPSYDGKGKIASYHSSRRVAKREILNGTIMPLYKELIKKEQLSVNRKDGMEASYEMLVNILEEKGVSYDEFIVSL